VDSTNKVGTIFGSRPFYGDGYPKELIRGNMNAIAYKSSSLNTTTFPQGLYLLSPSQVLGYIDPSTGIYKTIWGNQVPTPNVTASGTTISPDISMGPTSYANYAGFMFDSNGLPWLRIGSQLRTIDSNKITQGMVTGPAAYWDDFAEGADPRNSSLYVNATAQNLTMMGSKVFLMGGQSSITRDPTPQIRFLDFLNNTISIILGNGYQKSQGLSTPDTVAVGDGTTTPVRNSPLNSYCTNANVGCKIQYSDANGVLYFSDNTTKLHAITTPDNPLTSTMNLVFTSPGASTVASFSAKDDGTQLFWITADSKLRCYPLTAGGIKSWCPATPSSAPNLYVTGTNYTALGSIAGSAPNAITWADSSHMFIQANDQILEYTLPTGP
jgi:hypothetical protein